MKARTELWILCFFGFGVNYMLRININIAIVDMVESTKNQRQMLEGDNKEVNQSSLLFQQRPTKDTQEVRFHWDTYEQNLVLSAYFWTHWTLQLPGGMLAHYYSPKFSSGVISLFCSVLTFFIPLASSYGFKSVFVLRAMQGLIASAFWPSMQPLVAKWIPPKERGTFVSSYLGSSVGTAFTYFLCGVIIDWLGWQYAFYVTGILGMIWCIVWFIRVYDTPRKHPWITEEEREYIEQSLGSTVTKKQMKIPWGKILTSRAIFMNALVQWGANGSALILLTYTPMYLSYIHGLQIKNTGLWSGIPHLTKWLMAIGFGLVTQYQTRLSIQKIRKLATAISTIMVSFILYGLVFFECDTIVAVSLLLLANTLQGVYAAGPLASVIDMSPNFAGVLQGLIGMPGSTAGFIFPLLLAHLTEDNQTSAQWQKFFFVVSTVTLVCAVVYMFFGTSKVQPWNSEKDSPKKACFLEKKQLPIMVKYKDETEDETISSHL